MTSKFILATISFLLLLAAIPAEISLASENKKQMPLDKNPMARAFVHDQQAEDDKTPSRGRYTNRDYGFTAFLPKGSFGCEIAGYHGIVIPIQPDPPDCRAAENWRQIYISVYGNILGRRSNEEALEGLCREGSFLGPPFSTRIRMGRHGTLFCHSIDIDFAGRPDNYININGTALAGEIGYYGYSAENPNLPVHDRLFNLSLQTDMEHYKEDLKLFETIISSVRVRKRR